MIKQKIHLLYKYMKINNNRLIMIHKNINKNYKISKWIVK